MGRVKRLLPLLALALALPAAAERMQIIGGWEAHYSLVPTTFLRPEIATRYGITRARDRALLNVSVVDPDEGPVRAAVSGRVTNLLGQVQPLSFNEVVEGSAVYYLAQVEHTDREVLRFHIDIATPDGTAHSLEFNQKMYWEGR